jgi:hypothetical protein
MMHDPPLELLPGVAEARPDDDRDPRGEDERDLVGAARRAVAEQVDGRPEEGNENDDGDEGEEQTGGRGGPGIHREAAS